MNWFTKEQVASATPEKKKDLITNWGGCEHSLVKRDGCSICENCGHIGSCG